MITPPLYAGMDDEWVAIIQDEIAHEDSIEWLFAPLVDDRQLGFDLFEDVDDRDFGSIEEDHEWIRRGGA